METTLNVQKNPYEEGSALFYIWKNVQIIKTYSRPFFQCFGVRLSLFWDDNLTGFNITTFDTQFLQSRDDQSVREAVQERFGETGVMLIEKLISYGE